MPARHLSDRSLRTSAVSSSVTTFSTVGSSDRLAPPAARGHSYRTVTVPGAFFELFILSFACVQRPRTQARRFHSPLRVGRRCTPGQRRVERVSFIESGGHVRPRSAHSAPPPRPRTPQRAPRPPRRSARQSAWLKLCAARRSRAHRLPLPRQSAPIPENALETTMG